MQYEKIIDANFIAAFTILYITGEIIYYTTNRDLIETGSLAMKLSGLGDFNDIYKFTII